jgi:hypothetical protein
MTWRRTLIVLTAGLLVIPVAWSGHEQSVYPSYYPHEIEIATVAPTPAEERLRSGKLHAYVGRALSSITAPPADAVGAVSSLGAYVVIKLNPNSALAKDEASACSAIAAIARTIGARGGELVFHPYPVTPFHGDYLNHADRAEAARQKLATAPPPQHRPAVRAGSAGARRLVPADWLAGGGHWDAAVEEVSIRDLIASATYTLNGWTGPRWTRSGWFHAYQLLAQEVVDADVRERVRMQLERLQAGDYADAAERVNLERDLVAALTTGCRVIVAGYTVNHEYFNRGFSTGVENIGFDALEGLRSPMFLRTVKLKDFPWNGWLQLGLEGAPTAAWNPIGGFTDDFGRLMWFAVGDLALLPSPYESAWMLNRISEVEQTPGR